MGLIRLEALDFRVFGWQEPIEGLHYEEKREVVPVTVYDDRLSKRYTYSGSSPLVFFTLVETDEGTVRVPQLTMEIPAGLKQGMLMITRDSKRRLQGMWLDDSFDYTPLGHVRFHNLSDYPVALDFREKDPVLIPQKSSYLRAIQPGRRSFPMQAATAEVNGVWKLFSTMPIPWKDGRRTLIFMRNARSVDTKEIAPVEMQIFQDTLRPRPEEQKQ